MFSLSFVGLNGGGALDPISLSALWSDISIASPATQGTNEDRTVTFNSGGSRSIELSGYATVITGVEYRINSGSWTAYSAPFSITSGQTLGFRATTGGGNGSETVTVADASRGGAQIDQWAGIVSGF